jgi:hypothetical protein
MKKNEKKKDNNKINFVLFGTGAVRMKGASGLRDLGDNEYRHRDSQE